MVHMFSLLYTLFQLAVCIILNVESSGMPCIFSAVVGGVWLIAGVMMGFGARIFFGSPYFSPGIVGWMCLLVAVATLPTRESMPASTRTSNGMHFRWSIVEAFLSCLAEHMFCCVDHSGIAPRMPEGSRKPSAFSRLSRSSRLLESLPRSRTLF